MNQEQINEIELLSESGFITTADKNLRCKIDSILRSLENLEAKKMRINFEIKKQRISLFRKREELKKVSKRNQKKLKLVSESSILDSEFLDSDDLLELKRLDSILFAESGQQLDRD